MRQLDEGESFIVTRNGVPVGELTPLHRSRFTPTNALLAAFRGAPAVDPEQFRRDLDRYTDPDPTPRG